MALFLNRRENHSKSFCFLLQIIKYKVGINFTNQDQARSKETYSLFRRVPDHGAAAAQVPGAQALKEQDGRGGL